MENVWFLKVGKSKGEWDFEVGGLIGLTSEEVKDFRSMCMVAIATAEEHIAQNNRATASQE